LPLQDRLRRLGDGVREERQTGTVGKALDVLEAIASSSMPLRFTDLLRRVDQPRGTLHRQVSNLIEEGLVAVRPDQTYELGLTLLKLASRAWAGNQFRAIAEPHLRRLHDITGETVHLGVLKGIEVIYLDKVEGRQSVRMYSQIGNAAPAYCTGVGKAALSALPDEVLAARVDTMAFRGYTEHTIADGIGLLGEIAAIRAAGVAYDRQEHEAGIHCVAAPIHARDREFVAAVSATAPVYRISMEQLVQWAPLVAGTASAIMDDMASKLGPKA